MNKRIICTTFILTIVILLISVLSVGAESDIKYGDYLYYRIDSYNNTVTITNCDDSVNEIIIPNEIGGLPVTTIGSNAFANCNNLTKITIPNSVTNIYDAAFYRCNSLEEITLPFIGLSREENGTRQSVLGYIFGYDVNYTADTVKQRYNSDTYDSAYYYIPSSLKKITITDTTQIPYGAFYGCENLTDIIIPDNISDIGNDAFYSCSMLKKLKLPDGLSNIGSYAFYKCNSLESIVIPDGITDIKYSTFEHCENLTSVTIPKSIIKIGQFAFYGCNNLSDVYITDLSTWLNIENNSDPMGYADNMYINGELAKDITIPQDITKVKNRAFYGWKCLVNVTIPENVDFIESYAFGECVRLKNIEISNKVIDIGEGAFYNCDNLNNIIIPDSITSLGNNVFYDCGNLTTINIGKGVTDIGIDAFHGCNNLKDVYISDLDAWLNINFYRTKRDGCSSNPMSYANNIYINGKIPTDVTIPEGTLEIKDCTFWGWDCLNNITIPKSVTNIGDYAFSGCRNLKNVYIADLSAWLNISFSYGDYDNDNCSTPMKYAKDIYINGKLAKNVTIPDNIDKINDNAFCEWNCLESVTISDNVTNIDDYAFYGCNNLANITMSKSVRDVGDYAFYNTNVQTVYYAGSHDDWDYIYWGSGNDILKTADINYQTCGDNIYWYITDNGTLVINGTGDMTDFIANTEVPWYNNRQKISKIMLSDGIISIGNNVFSECEKLTEITIPKSIVKIGINAFNKCENLATVSYSGTIEEWDSIQIDINNSCLDSARFYCKIPITTPTIVESETELKWNFDVSLEKTYANSYVYAVAYDNNNTLIDIIQKPLNISDSTNIEINKNVNIDNIKIFVWTDNMQPITTVWEREI